MTATTELDGPARAIQYLIRADAILQGLAIVAVFLPATQLNQLAQLAGLQSLPDTPLMWYLARGMSTMFVFHAALLWFLSADLPRYWMFVRFHTVCFLALGLTFMVNDIRSEMPLSWALREGIFVVGYSCTLLWLMKRSELNKQRTRE